MVVILNVLPRHATKWSQGLANANATLPLARGRCMGTCRAAAEGIVRAFVVQDPCTANLFTRSNHCNNAGNPTPL